ncbi:MAG: hypothetical protein QF552_08930 [Litorilituus sp.]|jgi:hypothetical protein|nr:hypothetical protein [Litorilituus sp.]
MHATANRDALLERRALNSAPDNLWNKLSIAQKFAASSLTQFGYDLRFIRNNREGSLAILLCNDHAATISSEGEIETSPDIIIRS